MFRIVESICSESVRFPIKPGVNISPGHILSIVEHEGCLVFDISNGCQPFGVAGNRVKGADNLDYRLIVHGYIHRMILDISKFDRKNRIDIGTSLYCSQEGMLTSKRLYPDSILLAKVIAPAGSGKKHMNILWL